jgi:hypothetical protein
LGRNALILTCLAAAMALPPFALAVVGENHLNARNMIVVLPVALLLLASGTGGRFAVASGAAVLLLTVVGAVAVFSTATQASMQRQDWRSLAALIPRAQAPRLIVLTPGDGVTPLRQYLPDLVDLYGGASATTEEIVLAALPKRHERWSPIPDPRTPRVPGFRLVSRHEVESSIVLVYRAARPGPTTARAARRYAIDPRHVPSVILQVPGAREVLPNLSCSGPLLPSDRYGS